MKECGNLNMILTSAQAHFVSLSGNVKNKHWAFSTRLNKLFVDINRWVQVMITPSTFRSGIQPKIQEG